MVTDVKNLESVSTGLDPQFRPGDHGEIAKSEPKIRSVSVHRMHGVPRSKSKPRSDAAVQTKTAAIG